MSENIKEVSMSIEIPGWIPTIHISCSKCGYEGQPMLVEKRDPLNPESVTFELGCPNCQTDNDVVAKVI